MFSLNSRNGVTFAVRRLGVSYMWRNDFVLLPLTIRNRNANIPGYFQQKERISKVQRYSHQRARHHVAHATTHQTVLGLTQEMNTHERKKHVLHEILENDDVNRTTEMVVAAVQLLGHCRWAVGHT